MDLGGLVPVAQEDGSILLFEPGNPEALFIIHSPYMYDAQGEYSDAVTMTLDNGLLTVDADAGWINDPGRAWPMVIDPEVEELKGNSNVHDTYVNSWAPNKINSNSINLYAGNAALSGIKRTYIKFTLPYIDANRYITAASFSLKNWDLNDGYPILVYDAYQYSNSWTHSSLTWNKQTNIFPSNALNPNGLKNISAMNLPRIVDGSGLALSGDWYNVDVKAAVQGWYTNNRANGLIITSVDENVWGQAAFHSSSSFTIFCDERPVLWFSHQVREWSISAEPPAPYFGVQEPGYTQQPAQTITVTNTGNQDVTLGNLPIETNWTIAAVGTWGGTIAPGGTRQFTIRPNNGLPEGFYNPPITIIGTNGASAQIQPRFTVQLGPYLDELNPTSWAVGVQGGTSPGFTIGSNTTWAISSSETWLSFSGSPTGSGNASFTISASPNDGNLHRTGTITVTRTENGLPTNDSHSITVTQMDNFSGYFTALSNGALVAKPSTVYNHSLATWACDVSYHAYHHYAENHYTQNGEDKVISWWIADLDHSFDGKIIDQTLADNGFVGVESYNIEDDAATRHTIAHRYIVAPGSAQTSNNTTAAPGYMQTLNNTKNNMKVLQIKVKP